MNTPDILARLIAYPTVSDKSNLEMVAFIRDYLASFGVPVQVVPDQTGEKAGLFATIGPNDPGGVVFSGHMDVVPASSDMWHSDPFQISLRNGRFYGRGTCDMKGFVACMLAAVPHLKSLALARPIHLALSYDEEIGCQGAPILIAAMNKQIAPPRAVIVGEPTQMGVVAGHKGSLSFHTHVYGHTGHSSRIDQGVSAVSVAARLICWLEDRMNANAEAADPENPFLPNYTTLHCGMVQGGTAANVIAERCNFVTDIRSVPGDDALGLKAEYFAYIENEITPKMRAISVDARVEVLHRGHVLSLSQDANGVAQDLVSKVLGATGAEVTSYGTEAGFFARQGWPTVVCGPGDIAQAHRQDEFVEASQLGQCDHFIANLARQIQE